MIDNSSCSWTLSRCCIEMPFLVRATELNPPTRSHRGLFNFQITHVGYGETWKEKGVVEAYSMKGNHPNHPLPGARLKTFTGLDNKYFIDLSLSNEKLPKSTYLTQCQNIGWMQIHADTDLYIQTNVCERQRDQLSHCH